MPTTTPGVRDTAPWVSHEEAWGLRKWGSNRHVLWELKRDWRGKTMGGVSNHTTVICPSTEDPSV